MALLPDGVAHNHPYWLEVQEVTPVSVSILWTLRPPPISAIPLNLLRQRQSSQLQHGSASGSTTSNRMTASRLSTEAGATATRSLNRRVTKVTLPNASPNKQSRLAKQQQHHLAANRQQHLLQRGGTYQSPADHDDWPSDDGATAVDEDETRDDEDYDNERATEEYTNSIDEEDGDTPAKIFDSNVSVYVNGIPWSQVMVGDRSSNEAFIVVYGLSPSRDYELVLSVEGEHHSVAKVSTLSRIDTDAEEKATASTAASLSEKEKQAIIPSASPARARAHTPPMQDTDATTSETNFEQNNILNAANSAAVSSVLTGVMNASTLQASIRKARKEASRAESALKNEIEAIRRGLERMTDVDHRSKQKVLALQESIRQANLHAKEIDDEAIEVEEEREAWEAKERTKDEEVRMIREKVELSMKDGDAKMRQDDDDLDVVAKELQKVSRLLEEQIAAKEKLEKGRFIELEQELTRVQSEMEDILAPPQYPQMYSYPQYGQSPVSAPFSGNSALYPHVTDQRQRNAALRGGFRNASSPSSSSTYPRKIQSARSRLGARSQEETSFDLQSGSSSAVYGSSLNPHNPEFIPASISSPALQARSALPSQTDYSPSALSRSTFSSASHHLSNADIDRSTSIASIGLSPRANPIGTNTLNIPWSSLNPSNNQTSHTTNSTSSLWSNSSMVSSPTLNNDIWGAPSASMTASNATSASSPLSLRQRTSIPFDLDGKLRHDKQEAA